MVTDTPHLYFQNVNQQCLEAYIVWLDSKNRGQWIKSSDIDPLKPVKLQKKDLYSPSQRKKIRPSEQCTVMYLDSNQKAKHVSNYLQENYQRKVKEVDYDGNCMFSSILCQISRHTHRYTPELLRKQTAYYLAKHWEIFSLTATAITDECLESYIRNLFSGYAYGDLLCLGVIGYMWKLKITVITPDLEEIWIYHNSSNPDIVLVFNAKDGLDGHYCGTGMY